MFDISIYIFLDLCEYMCEINLSLTFFTISAIIAEL